MEKYRLHPEGVGYIRMPFAVLEILEDFLPNAFKIGDEAEGHYDYYVTANEFDSENLATGLLTLEEYINEVEKLNSLLLDGEKIDRDSYDKYVSYVLYSNFEDVYEKLLDPPREELKANLNKRPDKLSKYIYLTKYQEIIQEYVKTESIQEWLNSDLEFIVKWKENHKKVVNLVQTNPFIIDDLERAIEDAFLDLFNDIDFYIGQLEGRPESKDKGLNLAEKLLIISLLQETNLFPKKSAYHDQKVFYHFLSGIIGEGDFKKKMPHAIKMLTSGNLTPAEAKRAIESLKKIRPFLEGISYMNQPINKVLEIIDNRIKKLSKLTPSD